MGGGAAVLGVGGLDVVITVLGGESWPAALVSGMKRVSRTQVEDRAGGVGLVERSCRHRGCR